MFKLTPRLNKVCAYVGKCNVLADIGTDHAFVPVTLVTSGNCSRAYACDVGKGPLARADGYIRQFGLTDRIKTILSDGFVSVPNDWDAAVIAGMGGELIARIISETNVPDGAKLVLQPMTKSESLRLFLYENGFSVIDEDVVREDDKLYVIMLVEKIPCEWEEKDIIISRSLQKKQYTEKTEYLRKLQTRLGNISEAASSAKESSAADEAIHTLKLVKELLQ